MACTIRIEHEGDQLFYTTKGQWGMEWEARTYHSMHAAKCAMRHLHKHPAFWKTTSALYDRSGDMQIVELPGHRDRTEAAAHVTISMQKEYWDRRTSAIRSNRLRTFREQHHG
jgi:hypothetical protein